MSLKSTDLAVIHNSSSDWTTADELKFMRELCFAGKVETLKKVIAANKVRRWDGRGMKVNRELVEHEGEYLLVAYKKVKAVAL